MKVKILILSLTLALITSMPAHSAHHEKDIVDTAVGAGSFNTLVAAVQAADLVETLKSEGPFTVFAPTDEAFAKLPEGTIDNLLKPENKEKLQDLVMFSSSHKEEGQTTLAEYVERMPEGQKEIYYATGKDVDTIKISSISI